MISNEVQLVGAKEALTALRDVEPETYKQMVTDIKFIVEPAVSAIERTVPKVSPLTHANHNGRSAFKEVKVTTRVTPSARASFGTKARLVQIETHSVGKFFGFEMMDMAGRGGWKQRKLKTRPYEYKGGTRTHKINGQQTGMKKKLGSGQGSRYVYPEVETMIPVMSLKVKSVIEKAAAKINRKLGSI
jgi:hypothetical protein